MLISFEISTGSGIILKNGQKWSFLGITTEAVLILFKISTVSGIIPGIFWMIDWYANFKKSRKLWKIFRDFYFFGLFIGEFSIFGKVTKYIFLLECKGGIIFTFFSKISENFLGLCLRRFSRFFFFEIFFSRFFEKLCAQSVCSRVREITCQSGIFWFFDFLRLAQNFYNFYKSIIYKFIKL